MSTQGLRSVKFGHVTSVIGHRGAPRLARENTIEAFAAAVGVGAAGIELDARRRADGVLVVHHDAHVAGRPLIEQTAADLPPWIPTLEAALDACTGAFVNVEIKNDPGEPDFDPDETVAADVIAELSRRPDPPENWIISSFRRETVDRCRALHPAIPTAWLTMNQVAAEHVESLAAAGHAAVHPWVPTVDRVLIERCHAAGLQVNTWTCNDPERAIELAGWGIDGICTDEPDVMVAALAQETSP
jgi:glycerophosphoryl diester phosphodiesterase